MAQDRVTQNQNFQIYSYLIAGSYKIFGFWGACRADNLIYIFHWLRCLFFSIKRYLLNTKSCSCCFIFLLTKFIIVSYIQFNSTGTGYVFFIYRLRVYTLFAVLDGQSKVLCACDIIYCISPAL